MSLFNENTTVEDLLALKKSALQAYLKQKNRKISGTKLELAERAFEVNKEDNVCMPTSSVSDAREKGSLSDTESRSNSHVSDTDIISVDSLNSGWTSDTKLFPQISHRDVEQYLIYSSHRTEDSGKMECYRQFIRGFNFYKEGNCDSEESCTSRPCEWSKPKKRKKEPDVVENITFKKIKYGPDSGRPAKPFPEIIPQSEHFRTSLCCKLSNINSNAVLLDLLPPVSQKSSEVVSDLNVICSVEVETSEHIVYDSDEYINLEQLHRKYNCDEKTVIEKTMHVPDTVIKELETRTRGQNENTLWKLARKNRITSSNFHDILVRKSATPVEKLLQKLIFGNSDEVDTMPIRWGRKYEPIARKKYIAYKKLHHKENVRVENVGLRLCEAPCSIKQSNNAINVEKSGNPVTRNSFLLTYAAKPWHGRIEDESFCMVVFYSAPGIDDPCPNNLTQIRCNITTVYSDMKG
ncbi:hypothetical protein KUTeg_012053 [Tegillarca granosa]|uniref:SAP domain-containing protein n=1 Tax=Tegillarca granosa TaxID=220873 RepID=A0ABQ9EYG4_TEGGR|nr:hypothetical protein KUTeg_012053 [Tegillarca granosa]